MKKLKAGCAVWLALFLSVLFAVMKLTGCIAWPWVWVLSPAWVWILTHSFGEGLIAAADAINGFVGRHKEGDQK